MRPAGKWLMAVSVIGLGIIGYTRSEKLQNEAVLLELLLNPLCFVGLPLAFYWLKKTDSLELPAS